KPPAGHSHATFAGVYRRHHFRGPGMRALLFVLLSGLAAAALPADARAQTTDGESGGPLEQVSPMPRPQLRAGADPSDDWRVTIGGGGMLRPDYLGSDDYEFLALPLFDLRYRDRFFLSTRDGLGANLLDSPNWRAGPVLKYRHRRDQDDNAALRGLGDVDSAGEAGGFVHYDLRPFSAGAEVRQGFGGHEGLIGDFFL